MLVHGFASSFERNWREPGWSDLLSEAGRQVIGVDLLGHGLADKPHDPQAYAHVDDAVVTARNAYDQGEFIASTYERFRPVNLTTGPDGALYIVDMHHGLIQHHGYETPYVKAQYRARELDKHLLTGRIFRIVADGAARKPAPTMSKMLSPQLVECLSHPNAWYRETAQRLLVEKNSSSAAPLVQVHTAHTRRRRCRGGTAGCR